MQFYKEEFIPNTDSKGLLEDDPRLQNEWRLAFLLMCQFSPGAADLLLKHQVSPLNLFKDYWDTYSYEIENELNIDEESDRVCVMQKRLEHYAETLYISCTNTLMSALVYQWVNLCKIKGTTEATKISAKQILNFDYDAPKQTSKHIYLSCPTDCVIDDENTLKFFDHLLLYNKIPWIISSKNVAAEGSVSVDILPETTLKALALALVYVVEIMGFVPRNEHQLVDFITPFSLNPYLFPKSNFEFIKNKNKQRFLVNDILFGLNIARFVPIRTDFDRKKEARRLVSFLIGPDIDVPELEAIFTFKEKTTLQTAFTDTLFLFETEPMSNEVKETYQPLMPILNVFAKSNEKVSCESFVYSLTCGSEIVSVIPVNIQSLIGFFNVIEIGSQRENDSAADIALVDFVIKNFMEDWNDFNVLFIVHNITVNSFQGERLGNSTIIINRGVQLKSSSSSLVTKKTDSKTNATEKNLYDLYNRLFIPITKKQNVSFDDVQVKDLI